MWYIGQTVKHVETDTPRVYLGVNISNGNVHFIGTDGEVYREKGGIPEIYPHKYIEYKDTNGNILLGEFTGSTFLGVYMPTELIVPVVPTDKGDRVE